MERYALAFEPGTYWVILGELVLLYSYGTAQMEKYLGFQHITRRMNTDMVFFNPLKMYNCYVTINFIKRRLHWFIDNKSESYTIFYFHIVIFILCLRCMKTSNMQFIKTKTSVNIPFLYNELYAVQYLKEVNVRFLNN